jgi:hypothetical protein
MREIYYRVYGIGLGDQKITLYEDKDQKVAENFAMDFTGDATDIYVERVYRKFGARTYHDTYGAKAGSEL